MTLEDPILGTASSPVSEETQPKAMNYPVARARLMVVEDEALVARDIKGRLERMGYDARPVGNRLTHTTE